MPKQWFSSWIIENFVLVGQIEGIKKKRLDIFHELLLRYR